MTSRRALFASYYPPQDDRDCGARRLFDFIRLLRADGWAIDFVAANGLPDLRDVRTLQQAGIAVHDGTTSDPVEHLAAAAQFDLAVLAYWPVAELYLPLLRRVAPHTRIVVDTVDLHFIRDARRHLQGSESSGLLDAAFAERAIAELNVYLAADAVLTVSAKEAALLADLVGRQADVVPVGEDMPLAPLPPDRRSGLLLLGSFQHAPNVDALEYLCADILPRVDPQLRERHPLAVVGSGQDDHVRRLVAEVGHAYAVGWVPSVVPYFHRARASLLPLRFGAGVKGKMIQALMTGAPTVSSSVGAEGLDLVNGEHTLIADDPEAFASAIERLLRDEDLCRRLAAAGRAHAVAAYGRESVAAKFQAAVAAALARPAKPPMLPPRSRKEYQQRVAHQHHQQIVPALRRVAAAGSAPGAVVLVASGGDGDLLALGDRTGWHFPRAADGSHRTEPFADGTAAVNHLEALRQLGGEALLLPGDAAWMLDYHPQLRAHLEGHYRLAGEVAGIGRVYDLRNGDVIRSVNGHAATVGSDTPRLIAFFLPQFHPIPENDRWWGEGFTEWRNVAKAAPLFPGHEQPRLPADLGFYDLRLADTRAEQAALARRYGLHGFCYYHYWFHGRRLLERPVDDILHSGTPDFPFCLCWANEPWSRRWDGSATDVLQPQSYGAEDDLAHIRWLLRPLSDARAIRIGGKPVFLVYRADQLPEPARTTDLWRREVERAGLPGLHLIAVETGWDAGWDATQVGFDAKVLFQPQFSLLSSVGRMDVPNPRLRVFDYQAAWPVLAHPEPVSYPRYDAVFPSWDNTPRRGEDGWVVHGSTPAAYRQWLEVALARAAVRPVDERVVFINAWNEWAEGCHLEPDRRHGLAYLEATRQALQSAARPARANGRR